ncbi:MAG TPA: hypothetical protein V6C65_16655 [Allocoleopsis sp.]
MLIISVLAVGSLRGTKAIQAIADRNQRSSHWMNLLTDPTAIKRQAETSKMGRRQV